MERVGLSLSSIGRAALRRSLGGIMAAMVFAGAAEAEKFRNAYVTFELPDGWTCTLEGTEWVCDPPPRPDGKRAMIIILTAKEVGPMDSPQLYIDHVTEQGRKPDVTVLQAPKSTLFGRALWLDASLEGSEIPAYITRYLARTEGDIGVLVTFSWHRTFTAAAQPLVQSVAESVEVVSKFARPEYRQRETRKPTPQ